MRHVACANEGCVNHGATYFDFEPAETIVLCPACGNAMPVTTLEQAAELAATKTATADAAVAASEAEAAANAPAEEADTVRLALEKLGDQPVTASDLLAILRPEAPADA